VKIYLNNNSIIIHMSTLLALFSKLCAKRSKLLAPCSVTLVLILIFFCILYPDRASSGPYIGPYLNSAHGSSSDGVKRNAQGFPTDYPRGLCAHCHEQHESIGGVEPEPVDGAPSKYLLASRFLSQLDVFCYDCHQETNSLQDPPGPMNQQWNYSRMAGGDTTITCPTNIGTTFAFVDNSGNSRGNCSSNFGSSHYLLDIANFIKGKAGFDSSVGNIDPCSGCHNPHRAQRDWPISRPSQHNADNNEWGLWGDNISDDPPYNPANERMSNYAASVGATYCAPYRHNSNTTREPDGCPAPQSDCSTDCANGSNLVNYVTFCTDCHNATNLIWSTRLRRNLRTINWSANGDIHGAAPPQTCCDKGDKKPPYTEGINYVLSCLDCHEPHGSPNDYLLRQEVNGTHSPIITGPELWYYFCISCHTNLDTPSQKHFNGIPPVDPNTYCVLCHYHGFDNYLKPSLCTDCPGTYVKTF
jgi:hypothetical protein